MPTEKILVQPLNAEGSIAAQKVSTLTLAEIHTKAPSNAMLAWNLHDALQYQLGVSNPNNTVLQNNLQAAALMKTIYNVDMETNPIYPGLIANLKQAENDAASGQ